ncbi:MAG: S41 family peptidase [Planctomycetota bacterium]
MDENAAQPTQHTSRAPSPGGGKNQLQIIIALLVGGAIAYFVVPHGEPQGALPKGVLLQRIVDKIDRNFVDEVTPEDFDRRFHDGLDHFVRQFDRNTGYVRPEQVLRFEGSTEGTYIGIGVVIEPSPEYPKISIVVNSGPAAQAGVKSGDEIQRIDDEDIHGLPFADVTSRIKGPPGTFVRLTVQRDNGSLLNFDVVREKVETSSISAVRLYESRDMSDEKIGYVRLSQFQERSHDQLFRACRNVTQAGAAALILDLRSNTGGVLPEAVDIVALFLEEGHILTTRGRKERDRPRHYKAEEPGPFASLPVAVLIDGDSASASEIVSAALRDHHRALLVGTESYGKWTVQTIYPLGDRANGLLKLTTRRHYPPKGLGIRRDPDDQHRLGLQPDIEVEQSRDDFVTLYTGWQEESTARINNPYGVDTRTKPSAGSDEAKSDPVLHAALRVLSSRKVYLQHIAEQRLRWKSTDGAAGDGTTDVAQEERDNSPADDGKQ